MIDEEAFYELESILRIISTVQDVSDRFIESCYC